MYPYINPQNDQYLQQNKLISEIEKAIDIEYSSVQYYEALAKLAPNEAISSHILEIRDDKSKYLQQFAQIYSRLAGRKHQPNTGKSFPNNFSEGLEAALKEEQHSVKFYLRISDETNNQYIKEVFRRAAVDKQQHAFWFLYYWTLQKK